MKHTLYAALIAATGAILTACDYNEKFEGFVEGPQPTDVKKLDYTLTAADYKAIADNATNKALAKTNGEEAQLKALATTQKFTETITAAEYLPAFLHSKWFTADNGSAIRISYDYKTASGRDALREDFESMKDETLSPAQIEGWHVITTQGEANWEGRFRNKNNYLQASANKQPGAVCTYLISPVITPEKGMHLTFDALTGYYMAEGGRLSLFLAPEATDVTAEALDGEAWLADLTKEMKIENTPGAYGTFKPCDIDLSKYAGQPLHIVFRYDGDGSSKATTTYQLDNVVVSNKTFAEGTNKDQFVRVNDKWNFDPSTTLLLYPTKNATTVAYFQAGIDWVSAHIDSKLGVEKGKGYVTSSGNNEYYSGLSTRYGNVDIRAAKAREQYAKGFEGMDDAAVQALLEQHLQETLAGALATLHPEAVPVTGIEVIYTLRIGVYTGTQLAADQLTHEIKFKVVGKGQFEYVKDSYKKL